MVDDVQVARGVDREAGGPVQARVGRPPTVALEFVEAWLAGVVGDLAVIGDSQHAAAHRIGDVDRAVGGRRHALEIKVLEVGSRAALESTRVQESICSLRTRRRFRCVVATAAAAATCGDAGHDRDTQKQSVRRLIAGPLRRRIASSDCGSPRG